MTGVWINSDLMSFMKVPGGWMWGFGITSFQDTVKDRQMKDGCSPPPPPPPYQEHNTPWHRGFSWCATKKQMPPLSGMRISSVCGKNCRIPFDWVFVKSSSWWDSLSRWRLVGNANSRSFTRHHQSLGKPWCFLSYLGSWFNHSGALKNLTLSLDFFADLLFLLILMNALKMLMLFLCGFL